MQLGQLLWPIFCCDQLCSVHRTFDFDLNDFVTKFALCANRKMELV